MTLSLTWLTSLFFISIRLGTVLLFTPIQAIRQLPIHARLMFIFSLSMILAAHLPQKMELSTNALFLGGLAEWCNGLILGTSLYAAFAVFQIAGQLIDNQTGFNAAAIFNPKEHGQDSLSSHLFSMLAVLFFFSLEGHHWLFKGLSYSFVVIPPGTLNLFSGFTPVIKQGSLMFSLAMMIASPIVVALLAVDLCGALITRNMPQLSIYFLTLPIKILFGLFLMFLMMNYISPLTDKVFFHCFQSWQEFMS